MVVAAAEWCRLLRGRAVGADLRGRLGTVVVCRAAVTDGRGACVAPRVERVELHRFHLRSGEAARLFETVGAALGGLN